jgi:hypothetical protein
MRRECLLNMRVSMSTIADNDDPIFNMVRVSSQSMLFLAGSQLNYLLTLVMCVYYTMIFVTDSLRVMISLNEADRLQDLVEVSTRDLTTAVAAVCLVWNTRIRVYCIFFLVYMTASMSLLQFGAYTSIVATNSIEAAAFAFWLRHLRAKNSPAFLGTCHHSHRFIAAKQE